MKLIIQIKKTFKIGINLNKILAKGGKDSKFDLILEEGDELFIPSERQTVKVEGKQSNHRLLKFRIELEGEKTSRTSGGRSPKPTIIISTRCLTGSWAPPWAN